MNIGNSLLTTILFIGNSATFVHDIPHMLEKYTCRTGYHIRVNMITERGYELTQHADAKTTHGKHVLREIARGYDIVFLQEHSNCITSTAKREATMQACESLCRKIQAYGGEPCLFVRPPNEITYEGYTPIQQSIAFDKLFSELSSQLGIKTAYVNRAFTYVAQHHKIPLWREDHSHTSAFGAYLAVCVLFSTIFHTSAMVLDTGDIPKETAQILQVASDKVVLYGMLPWYQ